MAEKNNAGDVFKGIVSVAAGLAILAVAVGLFGLLFYVSIKILILDQIVREHGALPVAMGIDWAALVDSFPLMYIEPRINSLIEIVLNLLDVLSAGHGVAVIFLLPWLLWALTAISDIQFSGRVNVAHGLWTAFTLLYGAVYLSLSDNSALELALIVVPAMSCASLVSFTSGKKRYSLRDFANDLKLEYRKEKDQKYNSVFIRIGLIVLFIVLFWTNADIGAPTVAQLYSLFFSSCLFVVGFLALIYTYAHEKIESARVKFDIQEDTNVVYRLIGITLLTCLLGLLVFTEASVSFSLQHGVSSEAAAVATFVLACTGTVMCLESTIIIFIEIADALPINHDSRDSLNIYFDEVRTPERHGMLDTEVTGASLLRDFLVDRGHAVTRYVSGTIQGLWRARPDVIVMRRCAQAVTEEDAEWYGKFVENGVNMLVFVDSSDIDNKAHLLTTLGIESSEIQSVEVAITDGKHDPLELQFNNKFSQHILDAHSIGSTKPLLLPKGTGLRPLVSYSAHIHATGKKEWCPYVAYREHGKGLFIFVGEIDPWSNGSIEQHSAVDCIEEILLLVQTRHLMKA